MAINSVSLNKGQSRVQVSLVAPVFNEAENLESFYSCAVSILNSLGRKYEIIFVDDASRDRSFPLLQKIVSLDARVRVIRFKHRCGQQIACLAGLARAEGEHIVTTDSDLQYNLKEIPLMLEKLTLGSDAVAGKRILRKDLIHRKALSSLLNRLMDLRIGRHVDDWGCSFCALDRRLAFKILSLGRNARFLKPAAVLISDKFEQVEVAHFYRKGSSRYSFLRLCYLALTMLCVDLASSGDYNDLFQVAEVLGHES